MDNHAEQIRAAKMEASRIAMAIEDCMDDIFMQLTSIGRTLTKMGFV